jgi:hypothetical protein
MKTLFTFMTVLLCSTIFAQEKMIVHTATSGNISGNITYIDHPDLNNNPSACLNYVHNWNPTGFSGVYNDNPDGLWYNSGNSRWAIYNEVNTIDMIEGASFNVYIGGDDQCVNHIATAANIDGSSTDIDNALFNGANPGPYAFMNTYYNPNAVYNPGFWGTYFFVSGNVRSLFEQNNVAVPEGAAFKIAIPGASTTRFTHTATAANIIANSTSIDHPELNGNPDATFLFMHYYGVNGAPSQINLPANTGVWYNGTNWNIYTEDTTDMPEGIAFDIAIGENMTLAVTDNTFLNEVAIYPNPANDHITISASNSLIEQVTVYSILGTQLMSYNANSIEESIDVSSLATGTYLLKVQANNTTKTMKFLKN